MFATARNTLARAALRYNKKTDTYKLVVAFNVTQKNDRGNFIFPVQQKCNFVSGDLNYATLQADLQRTLQRVKQLLRTDNIQLVK